MKIGGILVATKPPLIILTGPTAVGKTALSIALAKAVNGEIISADSMQVYRHMDIGTAKIKPEEMQGVVHHLIDYCEPSEEFHVVRFATDAKQCIEEIYERGHIPIIAGGTGFYIQAVLYGIDFGENDGDMAYREELERQAKELGAEWLHNELRKVDEKAAEAIHPNNVKRVIRALEYWKQTGEPISEHNEREKEKESPYNAAYFVLTDDRAKLYARIDERIEEMLAEGLVAEVQQLADMGYDTSYVSMQGLGYKEILAYLAGECTLDEAVYILKRDTRHFAKRQLTWFKREKEVIWLDKQKYSSTELLLEEILQILKEKNMLL